MMQTFVQWLRTPLEVAPDFPLSKLLARYDFDVMVYLDDLLFVCREPEYSRASELLNILASVFADFGFSLSPSKSNFSPAFQVEYLGYLLSCDGRMELTPRRLGKVRALSGALLRAAAANRRFVSFALLR